jgi:serine/threonine protein kinase
VYLSNRALDHLRNVAKTGGERYRLLQEVGRGAMGTVYAAEDTLLERRVAVKVLNAVQHQAESRILARLEHPGIVPVYDSGVLGDGRVFYAMRLIEGVRLDEYAQGDHSLAERLRVFAKICEPVAFAHSRSVLHRDLKPSNIMIGSFGEVLVLDWGLPGAVIGTPGFMAPEQASGGTADERSDVFALGRVLTALAGDRPPKAALAIAAKACAPNPADRYHNVAGLMADVARLLEGEPVSAHREGPAGWVARQFSRHKVLIGLVAAYLLMRAALIIFTGR